MNFDFSDEQKELKEHAEKFLKEQCDPSVVRRILEGDDAYDENLWKGIVEMGWTATALPAEYGGIGYGYLELCVIAEEMGRAVAPAPFSSSVYLATEAILLGGSEEQKQEYLPKLAAGELIGTLALSEGPRIANPNTIEVTFEGGKLNADERRDSGWTHPLASTSILYSNLVDTTSILSFPATCVICAPTICLWTAGKRRNLLRMSFSTSLQIADISSSLTSGLYDL